MNNMLLSTTALNKSYGSGDGRTPVLRDINISLYKGEFVAIVGPSGSGKSTLLNTLGCLDTFDSGDYQLMGRSMAQADDTTLTQCRRQHLGFVFQSFQLVANLSALQNVCLPLNYSATPRREWRRRGMALLEQFALTDFAARRPSELSGGQQQRVALARALINQPSLLLADEPTGSLDQRNGERVADLLDTLLGNGLSVLMVTHDPALAARAHRQIKLLDGEIAPETRP